MSLESDIRDWYRKIDYSDVALRGDYVAEELGRILDKHEAQPEDFPGAELHDRLLAETFDPRP